jgi:single-strand DNA-binding protein
MNKVILVGNLTKDPDYRTTPSGATVCNFSIAVQRRFANQQGVREADFINCVAWRQQADFVHRFFTKGRKIGVVGTLQTRTYDAQDGTKRYVTEVICDECEFVDSKPASGDGNQNYGNAGGYNAPAPRPSAPAANDFAGQGFTQVDDDDQLPF